MCMCVSTYCMHTFRVDDKQQGADHVRNQDEHRGNSSVYAKHAGDKCMLNLAHKTQPAVIDSALNLCVWLT